MNSARESARERFLQAARTVYVIECNQSGYYYVGMTTNLERRLDQHRTGKGSGVFVKKHGGLKQLLQTYPVEGRASARRLEHAVTLRMISVYGEAYVGGSNLFPAGRATGASEYNETQS